MSARHRNVGRRAVVGREYASGEHAESSRSPHVGVREVAAPSFSRLGSAEPVSIYRGADRPGCFADVC